MRVTESRLPDRILINKQKQGRLDFFFDSCNVMNVSGELHRLLLSHEHPA